MKLFAFDTETHLGPPEQPGLAAPPMVCGSIADENGAHLLSRPECRQWFANAVKTDAHLVGCNLPYDLGVMCADDPRLLDDVFAALDAGRLHDIAIREALIDIARGALVEKDGGGPRYGLELLADRRLGVDLSAEKKGGDSWRLRYQRLEHLPIEQWPWAARIYPIRDAYFTREIFLTQEGGPNLHTETHELRAAFAFELMRIWGLRTDPDTVRQLRARVEATDRELTEEFTKAGILRPDGSENKKHLQALVTAAYRGDPPKTNPSTKFPDGQVATDRDTLTESGDPLLEKYGRAGKNDKYLTTYLPIVERGTVVPWNPSFNPIVATTRASSNAQQFPKKGGVRECFRARPGRILSSTDIGGMELRTMSQRAIYELGYSKMADVLNSGADPHCIVAAQFMGISYEEAVARKDAKDPELGVFRDLGKIFNFGRGGGMGAGAMAYNARAKDDVRFCLVTKRADVCGVEKSEVWVQGKKKRVCALCIAIAKELGNGWLKAWPEQQELFWRAGKLTKDGEVDAVIPGSNVVRGRCGYSQWLNTPFQGLGAALVKDAQYRISKEMHTDRRSPMWGSHLLLAVHDELIAEHPLECASEAADRLAFIMRETHKQWTPDLAPAVEAEPALSYILSKEAKSKFVGGRWTIWEPKKAA